MIIDAHTHVGSLDTDRYPLHVAGLPTSRWWETDASAEHLLAVIEAAGVSRACAVQGVAAYGYDCRYAADAVAQHPDRLALVGAVDMDGPDPAADLRALAAAAPHLAGIRLFGVGRTEPTWLTDGRGAALWDVAAGLGINVVPVLWGKDLPQLRPLVEAHPGVPVALDHCGFPDLSGGRPFAAATTLFDLADLPAVHLKVSCHLLHEAEASVDPADLVDELRARFGAERMCWGSDYPQTQLEYADLVALAQRAARNLSAGDRETFFSGTALRLWWPARA